ncbi:MAG: tryptophan--tRNA ligase [Chloroflexi bacterium]|nr:tryptophan--tRNA ligase [Chloroflexota bacterium]MBM3173374.1 tryptophan--tRNA ligase [Chloroflexota bacterium]MBM3174213.1 tryptophan--tRNA ligase [Chloroflexota bacterium]MBM4449906.1 tryptophan--tRNA ligase [Chloroflexota bacterium]
MKKRVFSGARPTGRQHIGNYLGAIQNYVKLQDEYDCVYCIVDIHALTTLEDTGKLQENTYEMMLDWLAAGLTPEKSILFVQSHVPEVMVLHTLLSMVTPLGWLLRVPTFKEKARMQPQNVNYGLVGYPVLMTADIVLYKADVVPVGEDQLPHLELAREIARRFNSLFGQTFPEPQSKLTTFPMVRGLNGVQKMGKSYDNYVELAATPEETRKLVMTAVTDPARQYRTDPGHPEICNVYSLHQFFNPNRVAGIESECRAAAIGCVDCKKLLAEGINRELKELREKRADFAAKPKYVAEVLAEGAKRAQTIARVTLAEVEEKMGLIAPKS